MSLAGGIVYQNKIVSETEYLGTRYSESSPIQSNAEEQPAGYLTIFLSILNFACSLRNSLRTPDLFLRVPVDFV
jgi:hypothetical protein